MKSVEASRSCHMNKLGIWSCLDTAKEWFSNENFPLMKLIIALFHQFSSDILYFLILIVRGDSENEELNVETLNVKISVKLMYNART